MDHFVIKWVWLVAIENLCEFKEIEQKTTHFHLMHVYQHLSDQGTFTPIGAQGGGSMKPPEKTTSPPEFCNEICTICVRAIKKSQFCKKKIKMLFRFKMAAK